ncbi:MAG: toxin ParE1/3/4 [Crocinitomicaceae bacterium]|jgi:toxin ParE1/3/4
MGYNLTSSTQAELDVDRIIQYYKEIRIELARDFLSELKATRKYIQKHPNKIQVRYSSIRIAFLQRFPYGVHFKILDDTVVILSILGTSEDSQKWDNLT